MSRVCPKQEQVRKQRAWKTGIDIIRGIIRRRTLLALLPWDPTSWVFMYYSSRHKYEVNLRQNVLGGNQLVRGV